MITPKIKLLFTCPHGGDKELDVLRDRKNLPPTCDDQFVTNRQRNTRAWHHTIESTLISTGKNPAPLKQQAFRLEINTKHITMKFH